MRDEYLKLKLDKMGEKQRNEVLDYLLGVAKDQHEARSKDHRIESMADYTEAAIEINANWGKMQGLSSGYPSLDELTKGFVPGELAVVAAKTSVGKTALAVNIANNMAHAGVPVLFVTLEMTKAQLASRFMFLNGGDTESYKQIEPMVSFQKTNELDWRSIDGLIGNYCKQFTNGFVVIDHLHYFTRELEKLSEDLGRLTMEFKKNADQHKVPILLISHVRKTGGAAISMEDLRGSSYIAQDADIVLLCGRSEDGSKLGITIEKNRNRGFDYKDNEREFNYDRTKITELKKPAYDPFNHR